MKKNCLLFLIANLAFSQNQEVKPQSNDWLVSPFSEKAQVIVQNNIITLNNSLVKRAFVIQPNLACFDFVNLSTGQQLLRALKPEAQIKIDGKEYVIGGLKGQKENA